VGSAAVEARKRRRGIQKKEEKRLPHCSAKAAIRNIRSSLASGGGNVQSKREKAMGERGDG